MWWSLYATEDNEWLVRYEVGKVSVVDQVLSGWSAARC